MVSGKKESIRREKQGKKGDGLDNVKTKGENFYRNAKKVKALNMYKQGNSQRDASGKITKAASYQSKELPKARVEPNRKWFNSTRVISQEALTSFRQAVEERAADPYQVLLKSNKLPMSLIRDKENMKDGVRQHQAKIAVESAPFGETFGPRSQRKRVKIGVGSIEDLASETVKMHNSYVDRREEQKSLLGASAQDTEDVEPDGGLATAREPIFSKGQSKRIWNELYKVIDSSDVVIHVLDARDPEGTRCRSVEKHIRDEAPHKHLVFILNKCDLVPTTIAARWVRHLSKEHPTLAFHASMTNSFGKGSLITLLRQFSSLHSSRKQISVGFIGYPNTGKSSIINTLRKKRVCTVAPIPGETKVWQYITLMKRIYLIDCPGVVPPSNGDTEEDILLRGVVRVENVENPAQYISAVMRRSQTRHLERTYEIKHSDYDDDAIEFLSILARKSGRLLKGGEPDVDGVAKMVLNDFLRGKIPWFRPPPSHGRGDDDDREGDETRSKTGLDGRQGRLGEMPSRSGGDQKRKRDDADEGVEQMTEAGYPDATTVANVNDHDDVDDEMEINNAEPSMSLLQGVRLERGQSNAINESDDDNDDDDDDDGDEQTGVKLHHDDDDDDGDGQLDANLQAPFERFGSDDEGEGGQEEEEEEKEESP